MAGTEVEERLRALAKRRAEGEEQLRLTEQRLTQLEEEHTELEGALQLRRRQLVELQEYEERLHEELRLARVAEARTAVAEAVAGRNAAAEQAAHAARELRAAVERLEEARGAVATAEATLRKLDGAAAAAAAEPEPMTFEEEWRSLAPLVEQELDERVKLQLVVAAAESVNPLDIESLPEDLRILARARRRDILKTRRTQHSGSRGKPKS